MLMLSLLSAFAGIAHQAPLVHRGAAYDITYKPRVEVTTRTVGAAAGTRMSMQRCRWAARVQVERHVTRGGGDGLRTMLASDRTMRGSVPGACGEARDAIAAEQRVVAIEVERHVAAVAAQDRTRLLADLDAANAVASN